MKKKRSFHVFPPDEAFDEEGKLDPDWEKKKKVPYKNLEEMTDAELFKELRELKKDANYAFVVLEDTQKHDEAQEKIREVEQEITRRDEL